MEKEKRSIEELIDDAREHIFTAIDDLKSAAAIHPTDDDLKWSDGIQGIARQVKILNEVAYRISLISYEAK